MSLYHFVGIGGSGMSSLAQVLVSLGNRVSGSDRNFDLGIHLPVFDILSSQGIRLFHQNGGGIQPETKTVVISSAIEETIPDVVRARTLNIPLCKRAELLAQLFNDRYGVAVAGTSGKSTVTAMIGHILAQAGQDPFIVNGGMMKNFQVSGQANNVRTGSSRIMVIESDESDGSIIHYRPALSVINTISKDHKNIPELLRLFQIFADQTKEKVILNTDCPHIFSMRLNPSRTLTFSLKNDSLYKARPLHLKPFESFFECLGRRFHLRLPGLHNIYNALASIAAALHRGVNMKDIQGSLETFQGINRRFELMGEVLGTPVINDFAHNPEKISASLKTAACLNSRLVCVFQPHGYGPTRFLKKELVDSLVGGMATEDVLFIPEIFYIGGTTHRDISSRDLVRAIRAKGKRAHYGKNREAIFRPLLEEIHPGDTVLIMGGRDDTLTAFCQKIIRSLQKKFSS